MSESSSQAPAVAEPPLGHIDALPAGTRLGEFELQGLLGVGGFGMVYQGYDHSLHRPVAIKEYMPSALVGRVAEMQVSVRSTADTQSFRAGLTSFIAEARLLARFDHPSLVKVYRFWEANNTAYMAMPLYQGITLKQARQQMSAPPPEAWLRSVLWSVVEALKLLHANGTIHRDVSPDNIFLQDVGPPVLLDLGAARRAVLDRSRKHTAVLKVNYAPIEQYADSKDMQEGPWTDLYALGAVVHGCLCNEPPLPATIRVVRDRLPSFFRVAQTVRSHFGTSYTSVFIDAISHTLVVEPAHRTQNAFDFCEEMGLEAPEDLAHFDWRLALGDKVTLGNEGVDLLLLPDAAPEVQTTLDQPHIPVVDKALHSKRSRRRRARGAHSAAASEKSDSAQTKPRLTILRGIVTFLIVASVAMGLSVWLRPTPIGPQPAAEGSLLATPAPSTEPELHPAAAEPVPAPAVAAAPALPVAPVVPPVPDAPVVVTAAPDPVPTVAQRAESGRKPVKPALAKTSKIAKSEKPASPALSPPVHASSSPMAAEPVHAPVVAPPPKLVDQCVDAGLWSRPMCVFRQCQKPEYAQLPVCIADRKRWENRPPPAEVSGG